MRATTPARMLAWTIEALDRYWGLIGLVIVGALEAFVFGPRQMTMAMIVGGIVGAAIFIAWLFGWE